LTYCWAGCATTSIWTNRIDFPISNSLICVSFTFYSICVLSCFDLFISKCLIVSIMSVEKVCPSKIQIQKRVIFCSVPLDTRVYVSIAYPLHTNTICILCSGARKTINTSGIASDQVTTDSKGTAAGLYVQSNLSLTVLWRLNSMPVNRKSHTHISLINMTLGTSRSLHFRRTLFGFGAQAR
jgi:hypothetical protein